MSCILRISGAKLDIDAMLACSGLEAYASHKEGARKFPNSTSNFETRRESGASFEVSSAEFSELGVQIQDAIGYFEKNGRKIIACTDFPGVDEAVADFGAEIRPPGWSSFIFPPALQLLAGAVGVSLCISVYPTTDDTDESKQT